MLIAQESAGLSLRGLIQQETESDLQGSNIEF